MGIRSENWMHSLRYSAFALSWWAKLADGWGSVAFETLVYSFFVLPVLLQLFQTFVTGPLGQLLPAASPTWFQQFLAHQVKYEIYMGPFVAATVTAGIGFFAVELLADTEYRIFNSLAHCTFGAATYYLWKFVPSLTEKKDHIPMFR